MVDKRKNIKRKLRRLHAIRRSELRQASQSKAANAGLSKTDTLLSSMEALIKKMSMTPSTVISQPTPSAPIVKSEHTKEEIMNDIAKQRELDMVRSQVQYMYDQMNDDIRARRNKGEVMSRMQARGTNIKPSTFGIDEDDEIYKVQRDTAKSKQQLLKLSQQELLDEKEIAHKERNALHQHLSDALVTKISQIIPTPKKINAETSLQDTPTKSIGERSEPHLTPVKPPTATKQLPKGLKTSLEPSPTTSNESGCDETNQYEVEQREAQEFVDQSFEQVADTAAKLNVKATLDDFAQKRYDDNRSRTMQQLTQLRSVNEQIIDRMNEIITSHSSLSPERRLESALQAQTRRKYLQERNDYIQAVIADNKTKLRDAEYHAKRITIPTTRKQMLDKVNLNKEKLALLQQEYNNNKAVIDSCSENKIQSLKSERKDKMMMLQNEINDALDDDAELKRLVLERDKLQCMINTDNRINQNMYIPTDPNGAREALDNQYQYVEKYVNDLNNNGEE